MDRKLKISLLIGETDPSETLDSVVLADKLGFDCAWIADHLMPWAHSANQSPFVWSLLASCLQATNKINVGPCVTTPIGGRYHPMLIAQACGTLGSMYPGRFKLAVGSGEALNEAYFPLGWPSIQERTDRLVEGIALIRKLWESDEFFDFQGKYFPMKDVYLYTKPQPIPPIYFSALGPKSAYNAGKFGDHLFTLIVNISAIANTFEKCKDKIFPGFEAGARAAGKDPSKLERVVALTLAFEGRNAYLTENRKFAGMYIRDTLDEPDPRKIEGRDSSSVTDDELLKDVYLCSSWDDAVDVLKKFQEIGATEIAIGTGTNRELIRQCGEKLLPHFRS